MTKYNVKDENGNIIGTVEAENPADAQKQYDLYLDQQEEQAQFPAPQEASPLDTLISAIPLPGMSFLTGTARDVARGIGPTEKGKEILKDKSFMEALDLYGRGLGANIYSNATLGIGPAVNAAMGDPKVDADLALSRELYGPTGDIAAGLPFGIGVTKAAPLLSPVTKMTGADKFAPGGWQALKRILAGGADDTLSTVASSGIRGEDYGPADVADSFWQSLKTGTALELLLGGKRKAGKTYAEQGMTPQQKKMDDAILAMERMRKTQGPRQEWHETVRDELGTPGAKTLNKLRGLDEEGFQQRQLEAEQRQQMTPVRTQRELSDLAGEELQGDNKGRAQAQEATDRAYGYNSQYLPQFESQPRMRNVSVQRDWGEISEKTGKPIKTRVTIPQGYEDTIETRGDYDDYRAARGRAQKYADRISLRDRDTRGPPTDTEVFWYTIRDLEGQGGNAKVLGEIYRDRFRAQFPKLDNIITAQATQHAGARAAEHGGELWDKPWMAGTQEGKEARSTPANRREMEKGFLNQVIGKAAGTDKGTTLPRSSPNTRKIAAEALGPQRAGILDQFLRREEGKFAVDDPIIKNKGQALPGSELTKPTGMVRRGLGVGARLLAGAITGGPTGMLWAAPGAAARFRINPNEMMDENIAKNMVDIFGRKDIPQPRTKNKVERVGNVGGLVPLIRGVAEQERQERRERKRKGRATSKDILE